MPAQNSFWVPAPPAAPFVREARAAAKERLEADEWILTTGHGSFAMGTPADVPLRQYHTMLNAASNPPVARIATVRGIEETVTTSTGAVPLSRYNSPHVGDARESKEAATHLVRFVKDTASVTWIYEASGVRLSKTLRLGWRANTATVQYAVETDAPATVSLRPRIKLCDFHDVLADLDASRFVATRVPQGVRVEAEGHAVTLKCDAGEYREDPHVTSAVDYAISRAREGKDHYGEPLWSPGFFEVPCGAGATTFTVAFALAPEEPDFELPSRRDREAHLALVRASAARALGSEALAKHLEPLIDAADDYLVQRRVGDRRLMTVIAGYPWFADWGRDTMISMPGLMLACGRVEDARSSLETFASFVSEGMIPNRFDDNDQEKAHYNTVDASLWFLEAIRVYARFSGERLQAKGLLLDAAQQIIAGYERGTRFGIGVDPSDGLVTAGDAKTQLTWMDAYRNGVAFTPRYGKCVEINALWCNGLRSVAELLEAEEPKLATELRAKADRVAASFAAAFVRPDGRGLWDCLRPDGNGGWVPVPEIRPNQLFAASLPDAPLTQELRGAVLKVCRELLLTPVGMRTLAAEDPAYKAHFKGDMMQRDAAYHSGTVWPWLLGPYCEAVLRAGGFSDAAKAEAAEALSGVIADMATGCLGQITEVYDGDEPRDQEGCTAQAWSIAEPLRIAALLNRPPC